MTGWYGLGLATDHFVRFTVMDARRLGYCVHLIEDGCRGVNLGCGDVDAALAEMGQGIGRLVLSPS